MPVPLPIAPFTDRPPSPPAGLHRASRPARRPSRWRWTLLVALAAPWLAVQAMAAPITLYDAAPGTRPQDGAWLTYIGFLPTVATTGGVTVDTTNPGSSADDAGHLAGFFNHDLGFTFPGFQDVWTLHNPAFPSLDPTLGFRLGFALQLFDEDHSSGDRAGFSLILLGADRRGIELGFWENRVWAQSGPAFTQAEGAAFDTTARAVWYELMIDGLDYLLTADGATLLAGLTRDYSPASPTLDPYDSPNMLFLGDNTRSAAAHFELGRVTLALGPWPTGVPLPPSWLLLPTGLALLLAHRRRPDPTRPAPAAPDPSASLTVTETPTMRHPHPAPLVTALALGGGLAAALLAAAPAFAEIKTEVIEYQDGDTPLKGYLVYDDSIEGPRPGVLVVHEWWGLDDYARQRAEMIAGLGYVAFALDMYGADKLTEHPKDAKAWMEQITANVDAWRNRAQAGLAVLKGKDLVDDERVAAIGYCFGGSTVMQLAYSGADLAGVVSFHGSLPPAPDGAKIEPAVLVAHGEADPMVPAERVAAFKQALDASGADWQFVGYGGAEHGFTNPNADEHGIDGLKYDANADARSWQAMQDFLNEVFDDEAP